MLDRRECLRLIAAAPAWPARCAVAFPTTIADRVDPRSKTPGPRPVGIHATRDGFWILDAETAKVYLLGFEDNQVTREIAVPAAAPAGVALDGVSAWVLVEEGRKLIQIELETEARKAEYLVQGAGPLKYGPVGAGPAGLGAQGIAWQRGELYLAVPAAAKIHVLRAQDGAPLRSLPSPGVRPQGLAWDTDGTLWCADGNSRSFFKLDPANGRIIKQHLLPFAAPEAGEKVILPRGMTIWQRMIYFCSTETAEIWRTPLVNRLE
jgi:hypothetical protein